MNPLAGARSTLQTAMARFRAAEQRAQNSWQDHAYRTFAQRTLRAVETEANRFDAAVNELDVALGHAQALISE